MTRRHRQRAQADYAQLDRAGNAVRIRLNSIVVRARNAKDGVEIAYTRVVRRRRGHARAAKHCVLASWNMMIPYLVPELPAAQKAALHALVKTPLVYTSVALQELDRVREARNLVGVSRRAAIISSIAAESHR